MRLQLTARVPPDAFRTPPSLTVSRLPQTPALAPEANRQPPSPTVS
ncbi:MAG: hypothetical protein J5449_05335 [Oscillospiraceae bacterium]|nr:hypothetical protein [Oscillospiraceae bacterium]